MEGLYKHIDLFMHFNPYGGFFLLEYGRTVEMFYRNRVLVFFAILTVMFILTYCTSASIAAQREAYWEAKLLKMQAKKRL